MSRIVGLQVLRPWSIPGGFLAGVAIHSLWPLMRMPIWFWLVVAGILFVFVLFSGSRIKRGMTYVLLVFCFTAIGLWRFDISIPPEVTSKAGEFRANVTDVRDGMYGPQAVVEIKTSPPSFDKEVSKSPLVKGGNEGGLIQLSIKQIIPIGSIVNFSCTLKPLEQKKDELDRRFAYRLHQAQAQCSPKNLTVIAEPPWWDFRQAFADLRTWTNRRITAALPGEEGMLIAGMLYGERGMSQKSNDLFRRAGLTHLIAVSGSNITIVASIVFAVLLGFGLWRRQAFWMTTIILAAYVTFTGFSASVARAAVMGWLVLLARHVGRRPRTWHVLLISAFVLCLIDPWMLAFDAGFALSFLATIGLMIWSPIIAQKLNFVPAAGGLREAAATTISATLMTTPYMAFAFEKISLAGLITNLIAVPLVPWAMLFGALSAVGAGLPGSTIIAMPALGVAKIIFWSAGLADYLPWLMQTMRHMNFFILVATYALLIYIYFRLREKNDFSTEMTLFCQK